MLQRVDKEKEFGRGLFKVYFKPEGFCGSQCHTNLLSTD
jgi:hypothetical protein